jgi:ankyrin repeat protein
MLLELLAQGADPTIEDDEGWTAQELAISENLLSFVDIFKKHAAKQALSSASYAKKRLTL